MKTPDLLYSDTLNEVIARVQSKKDIVDAARPLPVSVVSRLQEDLNLEWTYNTNGIEGNSLTLIETKVVMQDGMTIGSKSLREHFEVVNHANALRFLEEIVDRNYILRCIDILSLHSFILANIDMPNAGRIRQIGVRIAGANFMPPSPQKVSQLLDNLVDYVNANTANLPIPILAAICHHRFVWIHPFTDGNGRTGRLLMNLILQSYGYPPCIILKNDRQKYYRALNKANNGDYEAIALMVLQGLERSLNIYLNAIPGAYQEYDLISNIAREQDVPYNAEYISLLARRGLISAHKEGRNWMTTKEAVLEYYAEKQGTN